MSYSISDVQRQIQRLFVKYEKLSRPDLFLELRQIPHESIEVVLRNLLEKGKVTESKDERGVLFI